MRCLYRVLTVCCQEHPQGWSLESIRKQARAFRKDREKLIQSVPLGPGKLPKKIINNPYSVLPRRLWDLYAGRVVHTPRLTTPYWAISHSWTNDMERQYMAVNQHLWKVPLPKGVNLETIRQEVLGFRRPAENINVEYCWLDILCLRQTDYVQTKVQKAEQRIDVPTIGNVYLKAEKVIRYLNGLGRALEPIDAEIPWEQWSDRHWMRRAWTLQEATSAITTLHGGLYDMETEDQKWAREFVQSHVDKIRDWYKTGSTSGVLHLIRNQMRFRAATGEVDKIAGLNYMLQSTRLPVYNPCEDQDEAWASSVRQMPYVLKLELLFNFPHPADKGSPSWAPSWSSL
ncbi:hypothetical protein BDZ91DRAFT_824407, partial [Kalaharituber pfeilii]